MITGMVRIEQGVVVDYQKIHKSLGQGNFVLAITEGHYDIGGILSIFCDLYCVEKVN